MSVLICAVSACVAGQEALTAKVQEVLKRTKTTRTTYSLYSWNKITSEGAPPREEWSAEFNAGTLHRVETPRDRLVADCQASTGTALSIQTGETVTGERVAGVACGISTNAPFVASAWLGTVQAPFGRADRVRLADSELVRTYDVSDNGVILHETIAKNAPGGHVVLDTTAIALLPSIPDAGMFDAASLQRSYVAEQYKAAPKPAH